ncbi:MAG: DUF2279 domain-containing protein [Candidatus Delongbacteria bacterium]|nr:DUF2279 domain-containing protein [Candidatus Delongbacteria bacterium]
MKFILLTIFIVSELLFCSADSLNIDYPRLAVSGVATIGAMGASYYVMQNNWWSDEAVSFHFDDGMDLRYAKNIDKAAHFYGGYISQDMYYRSLIWSNVNKRSAILWSTGLSCFVQVLIDAKDAFAPKFGFSVLDVAAGSAGAVYGALQKTYPVLDNYNIKFSYFYRENDDQYERKWPLEDFLEDYSNQIYWLTSGINSFLPQNADSFIPEYLGCALGFSINDKVKNDIEGSGSFEIYLSLDIDLEKLVRPLDNKLISSISHYLNYIKFPMPTLRFYPSAKGYWIYM